MPLRFTTREKRDELAERLATLAKEMLRSRDQGGDHKIPVTDEMMEDIQTAACVVGLSEIVATAWDAHHNRSYEPVETRAKEIYDFFEFREAGTKPAWVPGGNSIMQDEARICARKQLREAGHTSVPNGERA